MFSGLCILLFLYYFDSHNQFQSGHYLDLMNFLIFFSLFMFIISIVYIYNIHVVDFVDADHRINKIKQNVPNGKKNTL